MAAPVEFLVATNPNNADAVPGLVQDIVAGTDTWLAEGGDAARHALLLKARALMQALETPRETMIKHTWAQPGADAGLITGVDTGLWTLMAKNGDKPQKVDDLAKDLGFDPILLGRLLRHLAAMGYLVETGKDEYKPTNFSKSLSLPQIGDGYVALLGGIGASGLKFHKWARKNHWKAPVDAHNSPLQYAHNTDMDAFQYLRSIGYGPQTNNHMGGYRQGRLPWMNPAVYPVQEQLLPGADPGADAPFLVDVSGGLGHDIADFKRNYPNHPGRLILEDLPVVLAEVKGLDPKIERVGYDFYTEQPIKGARAYFMHSIMHDWPDDVCQKILARTVEAMKPGYSKLLINDVLVPSTGAHWENTAGDMLMMLQLSAVERTEDQWHRLIEGSGLGLKISKFWTCGLPGVEALIECERV